VVAVPVPVVTIVVALKALVVETPVVVVVSRRLLVLLSSSDVFSDEFFCVIGVGVILGCGEEFGDRAWPLA
jgi:hypothetical protein